MSGNTYPKSSQQRKRYYSSTVAGLGINSSDNVNTLPPRPKKVAKKRKASENLLSSVRAVVLSPFKKAKPRINSNMGTVCSKKGYAVSPANVERGTTTTPLKEVHGNFLVTEEKSPVPIIQKVEDDDVFEPGISVKTSAVKLDATSRTSFNSESLPSIPVVTPSIKHDSTHCQDMSTPDNSVSRNSVSEMPTVHVIEETPSPHRLQVNNDLSCSSRKSNSIPNLRTTRNAIIATKRLTRSSSYEDSRLKSSRGSADLRKDNQSLSGRPLRELDKNKSEESTRHYSSETSLDRHLVNRKKRDPTIENSICFVEADQVNYYQMLEEVGRGSFGSVCKCHCSKDESYYAMKIINKRRLIRKNGLLARHPGKKRSNPLETLHREIAILKKMDHPNVVKLIEVIDNPQVDNVYMVFELMDHGTVIDIPTENLIPEEKARRYFIDLVLGIEYLHYSKIIHRDIKPSNLLLDENDHVKIADFGVSDMFEGDDDLLNKFAGSPAFQAPETLNYSSRDKYSGKAVDIWAMGITLFCFIYGKCPFYDNDTTALYNMIQNDPVTYPDEPVVNPQLTDLISRMLSKEPKERITMPEIKNHAWVTEAGRRPLPLPEEHCTVIEVTEEEVQNSIKLISRLSSLILVKQILRSKSFLPSKARRESRKQSCDDTSKIV